MTRDDVKTIIKAMCDLYPNYHPTDLTATVNSWYAVLKQDDTKAIQLALVQYARTNRSGFAPGVGELIAIANEQQADATDNVGEEWLKVRKAICNGTYHAEEEFAKLSPTSQKAVGSPWQLQRWAVTSEETIDTSIAKHFRETYKIVAERMRVDKIAFNGIGAIEQAKQERIECNDDQLSQKHE